MAVFGLVNGPDLMAEERNQTPKYIFLFIGDGTSFPQRMSAEYYKANLGSPRVADGLLGRNAKKISLDTGIATFQPQADRLVMNSFPAQGVTTTYSANSVITDSASSATAIATGKKTRDGVISMDPSASESYLSIAKMAKAKGKKVGIVTSVSLDHATPAAFYANQASRNSYYEIARQIPASDFDFFGGGGFKQPNGAKGDQENISDFLKLAGYKVVDTKSAISGLKNGDSKIVAVNQNLDSNKAMPYAVDVTDSDLTLANFVSKGIELLDNPEGFFMMVEGGKVDWACHANDALSAIRDVLALDDAVAVAYEFLQKHPDDTLIVVTGDHETGGMSVGFAGTRYDSFLEHISVQKGSHTAFSGRLNEMKKSGPLKAEVLFPEIEKFFGLKRISDVELESLSKKAEAGDVEAIRQLAFVLRPFEIANIERAIPMSNLPAKERPLAEYDFIRHFGYEDPITTILTQTLNNKAGIGWTTFSHSGLPTPVSAVGAQAGSFEGYFDNTDLFHKLVGIANY